MQFSAADSVEVRAESQDVSCGTLGPVLDGLAGERHYSPKQIAALWGLSETKVRRMFLAEQGVLRIGQPSRRSGRRLKRSYLTMRIPQSVAERVHRRLCAIGQTGGRG